MAALPPNKLKIVRTIVETAPDSAIRSLEMALSAEGGTGALAAVRELVETEAADRFVRNAVFAPVKALFGSSSSKLSFPPRALGMMWRGLKAQNPELIRDAAAHCGPWDAEMDSPQVLNDLCALAAKGLRERNQPDFKAAAELCDSFPKGGGTDALTACLDLSPMTRGALARLSEWVSRMTMERTVSVRLAYRDTLEVAPDAGPRFFEMLAAPLPEPWLILRVISAVMDRPHETYLSESELGTFGERTLDDIEQCVNFVRRFQADEGVAEGRKAGQMVQRALLQVFEFEGAIETTRVGPWGGRLGRLRESLAQCVERIMGGAGEAVNTALPIENSRLRGGANRGAPRLTDDPNPRLVLRAEALLAFADEVRSAAANGGFSGARNRMIEKANQRLDHYIDYLIAVMRDNEVDDRERARKYLEIAADFIAYTRDEKTAQIVRRRLAAA